MNTIIIGIFIPYMFFDKQYSISKVERIDIMAGQLGLILIKIRKLMIRVKNNTFQRKQFGIK